MTIKVDLNSKVVTPDQKIWIVHSGRNRSHIDTFQSEGAIFLEFPGLSLSSGIENDDAAIRQRIRFSQAIRANKGPAREDGSQIRLADFRQDADTDVAVHLRTVKHLAWRIEPGDLIIVPGRGASGGVLFGEAAGSFFPQQTIRVPSLVYADTPVRRVNWLRSRAKLDLPPDLVRYFEKPPAIAEVGRNKLTDRFFDYAYEAYSTTDHAWASFDAPRYDGTDFLSLVPPAQLLALAIALYRAMEIGADIRDLSYDALVERFYDAKILEDAQLKFASPGRYNLKDRDARLAQFINAFVGLALAGALTACADGERAEFTNSQSAADPSTQELQAMVNMASQTAGRDVLVRADEQGQEAQRTIGMQSPAHVSR